MKSIFISGTDTNVGKTIFSAISLIYQMSLQKRCSYYKPIQTGDLYDSDAETIKGLIPVTDETPIRTGLSFRRPLSPHLAAYYGNASIKMTEVVASIKNVLVNDFNVVEGAGGLLVPLTQTQFIIDAIEKIEIPCVLVARSSLGTINHTLLSIEALRNRRIPLAGVVMMGPLNRDSKASIKLFGRIHNVISLPHMPTINQTTLMNLVHDQQDTLHQFFHRMGKSHA